MVGVRLGLQGLRGKKNGHLLFNYNRKFSPKITIFFLLQLNFDLSLLQPTIGFFFSSFFIYDAASNPKGKVDYELKDKT